MDWPVEVGGHGVDGSRASPWHPLVSTASNAPRMLSSHARCIVEPFLAACGRPRPVLPQPTIDPPRTGPAAAPRLTFAVRDTTFGGWLDINVVGWVLMIAGAVGLKRACGLSRCRLPGGAVFLVALLAARAAGPRGAALHTSVVTIDCVAVSAAHPANTAVVGRKRRKKVNRWRWGGYASRVSVSK